MFNLKNALFTGFILGIMGMFLFNGCRGQDKGIKVVIHSQETTSITQTGRGIEMIVKDLSSSFPTQSRQRTERGSIPLPEADIIYRIGPGEYSDWGFVKAGNYSHSINFQIHLPEIESANSSTGYEYNEQSDVLLQIKLIVIRSDWFSFDSDPGPSHGQVDRMDITYNIFKEDYQIPEQEELPVYEITDEVIAQILYKEESYDPDDVRINMQKFFRRFGGSIDPQTLEKILAPFKDTEENPILESYSIVRFSFGNTTIVGLYRFEDEPRSYEAIQILAVLDGIPEESVKIMAIPNIDGNPSYNGSPGVGIIYFLPDIERPELMIYKYRGNGENNLPKFQLYFDSQNIAGIETEQEGNITQGIVDRITPKDD